MTHPTTASGWLDLLTADLPTMLAALQASDPNSTWLEPEEGEAPPDRDEAQEAILQRARELALADVDIDDVVDGYVDCMLWCNTLGEGEGGDIVTIPCEGEDATEEARKEARDDCADFLNGHWSAKELRELLDFCSYYGYRWASARIGYTFALSRNGHGAGFFDSGCDALQKRARQWGEATWWIGQHVQGDEE